MRFFTRELYDAMQVTGLEELPDQERNRRIAASYRLWKGAADRYAEHLAAIKPALPRSMRGFASVTLHDGEITSADLRPDDAVYLEIEGEGLWGPRAQEHADVIESSKAEVECSDAAFVALPRVGASRVTLVFRQVKVVEGIEDIVGDWWLYDEVHLADAGAFEYCVLLYRSEFRVVADEVEFIDHGCEP